MIGDTTRERARELRQILLNRRREMVGEVRTRIRDARTERTDEVLDDGDCSDAAVQEGIDFALIQMKAETLAGVDAALARLAMGKYGNCFECGAEISEKRLRALPFAVRCTVCEDKREQGRARARQRDQRQGNVSLFSPV